MRETFLQGEVLQHDGKPAAGITVRINGLSHIEQAVTDNQGQFQFSSLPPGTYDIDAVLGTSSAHQTLVLTQGSSNVTLQFDGGSASETKPGASVSAQQLKVPDKARKKYEKAIEDLAKHDTQKAFNHLAQSLATFACYADALTLKSVLDFTAGHTQAAADEAQQAIHCDGSNAKAYFVLGAAFNAQGQNENAIRTLNQGIRFQPEAWQPYYELGKSFLALHRAPDAVAQLHRAAELAHNSFPPVYAALASALLQIKDYVSSRAQYLLFLKAAPNGPDADKVKKVVSQIEAKLHLNSSAQNPSTQR
jgi:tetratricopeptide (TPR) repeat protein